ncbi:hypothetical protein UG55_102853 [Frankia sp. EI5c]|uniref:DUF6457 domain-containing protein n=1 Tax=Frankia sp. EI5c TaxID=683316 RepID=UPI0007C38866|nr:DUF6457 domain-containing protein [Frankia sp. EI5c]OAA24721.1 hypothetical protein UG55_102853 [Frankia sp. EI5c]
MTAGQQPSAPGESGGPGEDILGEWLERVSSALELAPGSVDATLVLALARDVAHGVARPAAPLTAFLAGLAAGRAGGSVAEVQAAVGTVLGLLPGWREEDAAGRG